MDESEAERLEREFLKDSINVGYIPFIGFFDRIDIEINNDIEISFEDKKKEVLKTPVTIKEIKNVNGNGKWSEGKLDF